MDHLNANMITSILAVMLLLAVITVMFSGGNHDLINNMHSWFSEIINGSKLPL